MQKSMQDKYKILFLNPTQKATIKSSYNMHIVQLLDNTIIQTAARQITLHGNV